MRDIHFDLQLSDVQYLQKTEKPVNRTLVTRTINGNIESDLRVSVTL